MHVFNHRDGQCIDIDGASLYVEEQGNPDGPVLLFLPGGFDQIETWNLLTPCLADSHRLIGIDSRGHGRSTLSALGLSYRRLEEDVKAIVSKLGIDEYSVIGHSDGGIVALRLAADPGNPVRHIVPIGAQWALPPDDPARTALAKATPEFWRQRFPGTRDSCGVGTYESLNPEPAFDVFACALLTMWLSDGEDAYPNDRVQQIRARTLVIHGENDPFVSRHHTQALLDQIPHAQLLHLPFVGHAAHQERPDWLAPVLTRFLSQPRQQPTGPAR